MGTYGAKKFKLGVVGGVGDIKFKSKSSSPVSLARLIFFYDDMYFCHALRNIRGRGNILVIIFFLLKQAFF